jgi:hypothetical protein
MPRSPMLLAYTAAALQGLAMVSLPASATVLQGELGVSSATYGGFFLAQTIAATAGALGAGAIARRPSANLGALLSFALACHAIALGVLAAATWIDPSVAGVVAATMLGLGFGAGAVPLNAVALARSASATAAMHTLVGGGFAIGPGLLGIAIASDAWVVVPLGLAILAVAIAAALVRATLPSTADGVAVPHGSSARGRVAVLTGVAVAYAFAEGTFANWATVFLHDGRGVDEATAAAALGGFWAMLAIGRLVATALVRRVRPLALWRAALVAMAVVMFALPLVETPLSGVLAFAAAGFATAAAFPMTVALATSALGLRAESAAALLTAALMIGVGAGSFAIGALREALDFTALYRIGAAFPLVALALGSWLFRTRS